MPSTLVSGTQRVAQALSAVMLSVAALYFGREVLVPLAMAVLLTFLLSPLVSALERRRMRRVPAVLLVMAVIFSVGLVAAWALASQVNELALRLPEYKLNLQQKLASLHGSGGTFDKVQQTVQELSRGVQPPAENVQPVRIVSDGVLPLEELKSLGFAFMGPLASAGIVLVLVIFMLISREDMRNRLVRLAGTRLALTTRTLDDIGSRISRYLLLNALVNGGFGIAVGIGLAAIGVEYAVTWGLLAAVLRFVPYLGTMLASALPIAMAFIQFPGTDWLHPILVASLFLVVELIANNVIEPLVYGASTGVSTVALIVAAMFWTWIWGPVGLVLAVPLTVVLTVLGEYVEALEPLAVLLGDKPPLAGWISYYQRLLANDVDEASAILDEARDKTSLLDAYDRVVIPALLLAQKDAESGELLEPEQQFIWQTTRDFIEEHEPDAKAGADPASGADPAAAADPAPLKARIVGCPAHELADELPLNMLRQGLCCGSQGRFDVLASTMLAAEMLARIAELQPDAVCISSVGPPGVRPARYLCKRIRQSFPTLTIIVGRWSFGGDRSEMVANMRQRGADQVVTTLAEARDLLVRIMPIAANSSPASLPPAPHIPQMESPQVKV